jgi:diaminohydroxyphosphoribosylaminopyrimidine deaminase/5-amino-6-(5-phosphoribosylamino)uracil reductase
VRVVADGRLRTPATARLIGTAAARPTWILTREGGTASALARLPGVSLIPCRSDSWGTPEAAAMLLRLAGRGLTRVLVEGGGRLAAALLAADLVDELVWHRAPIVLGGEGRPAVAALPLTPLAALPRWRCIAREQAGEDLLETYRRAAR